MKIINGCRKSGKSWSVINKLNVKDLFITLNKDLVNQAYEDWIKIHNPSKTDFNYNRVLQNIRPTFTTFNDFMSGYFTGCRFEHIYIDNLDDILFDFIIPQAKICLRYSDELICTTNAGIEFLPNSEDLVKNSVDSIGTASIKK